MEKQNILIVDDESTNISILVEILKEKYNLLVATDGATALEIVNSNENIDLVLLDIVMPKMDGYEVAHHLKNTQKRSKIPFIFLTAKSDSQSIVKGFLEGAVDYISKPFAKEELLARVHTHLQLHTLNSELIQHKNFLQTSEERLRFALEGAGDGLWDWNLKTNEVFFSKRWKEMLGFTEDEITNTLEEWKNRVHPQDLEQVYADITAHIEGKNNIYINEHRVKCKDGSFKWVLDRGMVVSRDVDGIPMRMVGSHSDISERKKFQLKQKEYISIIDKNVIFSTTDLDGTILDVSEAFCKLTGYSREEFIGKNHNILRCVDSTDNNYKVLWDTIISGQIWNGEVKNIKKDGSFYWVNATILPVFDDDIKIGYMAFREDITDKKAIEAQQLEIQKSEEKLKKLFDHQGNIIVISDGKKLKMANKAMCNFFGIEKVEEFTKLYSDISDKFMEMNDYFSLANVQQGANWIEVLEPLLGDKRVIAMDDLDEIPHAFSVSISKFDGDDYIVSLTDISSTMIEKINLKNKVTHDKLTGALNREFLDINLPHIVNKIGKTRHLGLAILDIDFFKRVNDTCGHIVGDTVLKELTTLVISSIRNEDFFIRWGGEEFILLIESESIESLKRALEHIRQRVAHHTFSDVGAVTCSFGATLYMVGEDIDTTIQRADKALYKAKESGRNQVQVEMVKLQG